MPAKPTAAIPKSASERMQARRERLRSVGLRPVQHWVPDLRRPDVLADIRREAGNLGRHPDNDAIDAWIEAVTDPADWS